jgi:hypothetical protein
MYQNAILGKSIFRIATAVAMLTAVAVSDASAFFIGNHRGITNDAIEDLKATRPKTVFSDWEKNQLETGAADADVIEGGWAPGGSRYEPRYHFDGHVDYEAIAANYRDLVAVLGQNLVKPTPDPWEFGKVLHAIQDFYSHSNYIPLYQKYKENRKELIGSIPTLEEVLLSPSTYPGFSKVLILRLRTGHYPNRSFPADKNSDHGEIIGPGMHKDTWQRDYHEEARNTAVRATAWYLRIYLKDTNGWDECNKLWGVPSH